MSPDRQGLFDDRMKREVYSPYGDHSTSSLEVLPVHI
jgi:hypothetical protein